MSYTKRYETLPVGSKTSNIQSHMYARTHKIDNTPNNGMLADPFKTKTQKIFPQQHTHRKQHERQHRQGVHVNKLVIPFKPITYFLQLFTVLCFVDPIEAI